MRTIAQQLTRALAGLLALLGCLWLVGCDFEPIARPVKPRRVWSERGQLIANARLDLLGKYVPIHQRDELGHSHFFILAWQDQLRCELPNDVIAPLEPLLPAARNGGRTAFYLPLLRQDGVDAQLVVVDPQCRVQTSFPAVAADSVRTVRSAEDQRGLLIFRDLNSTQWLLDVWSKRPLRRIADNVTDARIKPLSEAAPRDVFWLLEDGHITLRSDTGALITSLGDNVTTMALGNSARVAFASGGALFEAVGPQLQPTLIAQDTCEVYYQVDTLSFFAPCAQRRLRRHEPGRDELYVYPSGVVYSQEREGMTLQFEEDEEGARSLYAESRSMARQRVTPLLRGDPLTVLDAQRIAGISEADDRLIIWHTGGDYQLPLADDKVNEVTRHYRGKTHESSLLVHHGVVDQLGTISLITENDSTARTIASKVPSRARNGYMTDSARGIPNNPFPDPVLLLIDDAAPVDGEPELFAGRLRAMALSGEPAAFIAEGVTSFTFVASPMPGVLYTVDSGPDQGFWFAAL